MIKFTFLQYNFHKIYFLDENQTDASFSHSHIVIGSNLVSEIENSFTAKQK